MSFVRKSQEIGKGGKMERKFKKKISGERAKYIQKRVRTK
jgi:hypothetical protein